MNCVYYYCYHPSGLLGMNFPIHNENKEYYYGLMKCIFLLHNAITPNTFSDIIGNVRHEHKIIAFVLWVEGIKWWLKLLAKKHNYCWTNTTEC